MFLAEPFTHTSPNHLCKELSEFESNCGKKRSQKVRTCRSKKKKARETIRNQRGGAAHGFEHLQLKYQSRRYINKTQLKL